MVRRGTITSLNKKSRIITFLWLDETNKLHQHYYTLGPEIREERLKNFYRRLVDINIKYETPYRHIIGIRKLNGALQNISVYRDNYINAEKNCMSIEDYLLKYMNPSSTYN